MYALKFKAGTHILNCSVADNLPSTNSSWLRKHNYDESRVSPHEGNAALKSEAMYLPVLARILCSLLTKSAMYCLLTVLDEPAEKIASSA